MAVGVRAGTSGPISFVGVLPDAGGVTPADLMVVLVFAGPNQQIYWAERVAG